MPRNITKVMSSVKPPVKDSCGGAESVGWSAVLADLQTNIAKLKS